MPSQIDFSEYFSILVFLGFAVILSTVIILIPKFFAVQKPEEDKLSPYECGFDPIGEAHRVFDVKFYLVAILFIIFDLEITFLIPWAISLGGIGLVGFFSMMAFLLVLTFGFIYEWKKGALEW